MQKVALLYVPVIHAGYIQCIDQLIEDTEIYVLDSSAVAFIDAEFDYLRKEIRSLTPEQALQGLQAIFPKRKIQLISSAGLTQLAANPTAVVTLPQEDIFAWLSDKLFSKHQVHFTTTFLRWDRKNTVEKHATTANVTNLPSGVLTAVHQAYEKSQQSSDWWRQVGCILLKESTIVAASHNSHLPTPHTPYLDGDVRNAFHKGENINLSTAIHAEAKAIAECAKNGISLAGATMVVTTFPCPSCAKLVAAAGIKTVYFSEGYAVLDGEKVLTDAGVDIHKIPT